MKLNFGLVLIKFVMKNIVDFYCPAAQLVIEVDGGIQLRQHRLR
jgi:very-short-patch-repair endonuclease